MLAAHEQKRWLPTAWPAELWAALLLTLGTLIAFCQVVNYDFVNYDDPVYVYQNMGVQGGFFDPPNPDQLYPGLNLDTVEWAFRARVSAHWHPLTLLSLALDWSLYGEDARGFHVTNVLLHLASTLLLFWILRLSTGSVWRSAAAAGLFAWHPLHVESVAWITERKDVLSTFFWMLTMLTYVKYVQRRAGGQTFWKPYALMIFFFVLGLLSKPMVVTLPCVLLLWDFWPLKRLALFRGPPRSWISLVIEKIPLFALSLASGIWTWVVMHGGTVRRTTEVLTPGTRVQNALLAAVTLLRKMVWPSDLAVHYPVQPNVDTTVEAILAGVFLAICTLLAFLARRRAPCLLMGWLWYLGTLVLVVLRLQAGSFTWADRYTYVPMIGIFIALVWGLCDCFERFRRTLIIGFAALLLACLVLTWQQVKVWEDSETLWKRTLSVTEDNFLAEYDLGLHLRDKNRLAEALPHFAEAARILPDRIEFRSMLYRTHLELGESLLGRQPDEAKKQLTEAAEGFRRLMRDDSDNPDHARKFEETQRLLHGMK